MNFFLMCCFSVSLSLSAGAVRFCTGPAFAVAIMHSQLNFFVEIILKTFSDDLCPFVLLLREFPSPYARHPLFSSGIRLFVPSFIPLVTFGRPLFSSRFPLFSFSHSNSLRPHSFSLSFLPSSSLVLRTVSCTFRTESSGSGLPTNCCVCCGTLPFSYGNFSLPLSPSSL